MRARPGNTHVGLAGAAHRPASAIIRNQDNIVSWALGSLLSFARGWLVPLTEAMRTRQIHLLRLPSRCNDKSSNDMPSSMVACKFCCLRVFVSAAQELSVIGFNRCQFCCCRAICQWIDQVAWQCSYDWYSLVDYDRSCSAHCGP